MSYSAVGRGALTLRFDEPSKTKLKTEMSAYYDRLCSAETADANSLSEYIEQQYQEKKRALEQDKSTGWLREELSDLGFDYVGITESQQMLSIDTYFDGKYCEDRIAGFLEVLAPFTVEGDFSFRGEDDDELWCLQFSGTGWMEQSGEIVYAGLPDPETQVDHPYRTLIENSEAFGVLLSEVEARLRMDQRPNAQRGGLLLAAFRDHNPDGVLLALTGWSLQSLGALAGIWPKSQE